MTLGQRLASRAVHSNPDFSEMEHAITLLRDMRIRLSLFVFEKTDGSVALTATLSEGLGRLGLVGTLDDGRLVLLHMAPRVPGSAGDASVERLVSERLGNLVADMAGRRPARLPKLGVTHFQSDRASSIAELLREATARLASSPANGRFLQAERV